MVAIAVGWSNLNGNGGGSGKKAKPFIIVEGPTLTTRECPGLIVVVDCVAIPVQVFTNDRATAVVARIWKPRRRTVLTEKGDWQQERRKLK